MIDRFPPKMLIQPPNPVLMVSERARLECGCSIYVGLRVDNWEVATGAVACTDEHAPLVNRANVLLFDSLEHPTDRPLVDVCEEFLIEAAA